MIRINLLPPEIHVAEVRRQFAILGGILGGLVVFSMLVFLGTRITLAARLQKDLSLANDELRKYQAIVDQVNTLEQTRNQLKARRDVIQQLLKGRLLYPKFFEDFMGLLPSEIWISSLNTSPAEGNAINVSLNAQSTSNFAIADWLSNLQKSPYCSAVELGSIGSQDTEDGRAPLLNFSMRFKYTRGDA